MPPFPVSNTVSYSTATLSTQCCVALRGVPYRLHPLKH